MCILCQQTSPKRWFGNRTMTSFVTSQTAHTKYKWLPYAAEWNPPHEKFLRTPLVQVVTLRDQVRSCKIICKTWMSSHISESRDSSYVGSAMCPECPRKDWRGKSCWLLPTPTGKRPTGRPRTKWSDYISNLARSRLVAEPAELSKIAVDREVFRALLLPPQTSPNDLVWICSVYIMQCWYRYIYIFFYWNIRQT